MVWDIICSSFSCHTLLLILQGAGIFFFHVIKDKMASFVYRSIFGYQINKSMLAYSNDMWRASQLIFVLSHYVHSPIACHAGRVLHQFPYVFPGCLATKCIALLPGPCPAFCHLQLKTAWAWERDYQVHAIGCIATTRM